MLLHLFVLLAYPASEKTSLKRLHLISVILRLFWTHGESLIGFWVFALPTHPRSKRTGEVGISNLGFPRHHRSPAMASGGAPASTSGGGGGAGTKTVSASLWWDPFVALCDDLDRAAASPSAAVSDALVSPPSPFPHSPPHPPRPASPRGRN